MRTRPDRNSTMHDKQIDHAATGARASRRLLHRLGLAAACCVLLGVQGCGDDVTPMNTKIAGTWQVQCAPVNEDCSNFSISFAADGDIADTNVDGHKGPQRGHGEIVGTDVVFTLGFGKVYEYRGALDGAGNVATGKMTNYDYDGQQKTTPATLTRK
jgi:hypothetical protein